MVCLGVEPGVVGWWAQTYPLSYGSYITYIRSTPIFTELHVGQTKMRVGHIDFCGKLWCVM